MVKLHGDRVRLRALHAHGATPAFSIKPYPRRERQSMEHAGTWIVDLYRVWGKPAKAAEWQARLNTQKAAPTP